MSSSVRDIEEREVDDKEVFEVKLILDHDEDYQGTGKLRYLIAWERFGPEFNSWEPIDVLDGCPDVLDEYNKKYGLTEKFQLRTILSEEISDEDWEEMSTKVAKRHFAHLKSWENVVEEIVNIRQMQDVNNRASFCVCDMKFERGFLYTYKIDVVKERCPQKLLNFLLGKIQMDHNLPNLPNLPQMEISNQTQTNKNQTQSQPKSPILQDSTSPVTPQFSSPVQLQYPEEESFQIENNVWSSHAGPSRLGSTEVQLMTNVNESNFDVEFNNNQMFTNTQQESDPWEMFNLHDGGSLDAA